MNDSMVWSQVPQPRGSIPVQCQSVPVTWGNFGQWGNFGHILISSIPNFLSQYDLKFNLT